MTEKDIMNTCKKYDIENYTINSDTSIDVDEYVHLSLKSITHLPLKFNNVYFSFYCHDNLLTTLVGMPLNTKIIFNCSNNNLSTLNSMPINFYVGGDFYCANNNITSSIEYGRLFFGTIGGSIYTGYDNLDNFLNKHKNPPKKDLPKLLSELRKIQL